MVSRSSSVRARKLQEREHPVRERHSFPDSAVRCILLAQGLRAHARWEVRVRWALAQECRRRQGVLLDGRAVRHVVQASVMFRAA